MGSRTALYYQIKFHLTNDSKPSQYLEELKEHAEFQDTRPFSLLYLLTKVEQSPVHHPEGNVWRHTMQVVDEAALRKEESSNPAALMLAALLHDIGKGPATAIRKGKITAYGHEDIGAKMAREFLIAMGEDESLVDAVIPLVRWHMEAFFAVQKNPHSQLRRMLMEAPYKEVALLALCDRLGRRGGAESPDEREEREHKEMVNYHLFLQMCSKGMNLILKEGH